MNLSENSHAIAARIRALIAGQNQVNISATAHRLGVSEAALRATLDERGPRPHPLVLLKIVEYYGVDPTWLVTGTYDIAGHRRVLADEELTTRSRLERMLARQTPSHVSPTEGRESEQTT